MKKIKILNRSCVLNLMYQFMHKTFPYTYIKIQADFYVQFTYTV